MLTESRVFNIIGASLFVAAGIYAWWTDKAGQLEWAGTFALILSGLLCVMCGFYFAFVARRIHPRPEDRVDAQIADGAGEVGFFSPSSYWPAGIAVAVAVTGVGIAYAQLWLVGVGLTAAVFAACGLLFEYYTGARRRGPL